MRLIVIVNLLSTIHVGYETKDRTWINNKR